jgi:hypothetical protein
MKTNEELLGTVEITVEGGVVQNVYASEGIEVVVYDYDTDGVPEEDLFTDSNGHKCVRTVHEAT